MNNPHLKILFLCLLSLICFSIFIYYSICGDYQVYESSYQTHLREALHTRDSMWRAPLLSELVSQWMDQYPELDITFDDHHIIFYCHPFDRYFLIVTKLILSSSLSISRFHIDIKEETMDFIF